MNPQFRLTQPAMRDIQEIIDYLAQKSGFPQSEKFIHKLNAQFARIVLFPQSGKPRNDLLLGSRMLLIDRYLIFYISIGEDMNLTPTMPLESSIDAENANILVPIKTLSIMQA